MTRCRSLFACSMIMITLGFAAALCSLTLRSAAAQGKGNGNGKGNGSGNGGGESGWVEHFSDSEIGARAWGGWEIEQTGPNAKFGIPGVGLSGKSFDAGNVSFFSGVVRLQLSISSDLYSSGALIYTRQTYGLGTYEWCARMSSTAASPEASSPDPDSYRPPSGGVSAGFTYVNDSETEIDFEQAYAKDASGIPRLWLYMGNWRNLNPLHTAQLADPYLDDPALTRPYDGFKLYKFVWTKRSVEFYVDGDRLARHTRNVPSAPAHVMLNHWGTNNPNGFGGEAESGVRYFFVDWVRYTPSGTPSSIACGPPQP